MGLRGRKMKSSTKMLIFDILSVFVWIIVIVYNCLKGPTLIAYISLGISFLTFILLYFITSFLKLRRIEKDCEEYEK